MALGASAPDLTGPFCRVTTFSAHPPARRGSTVFWNMSTKSLSLLPSHHKAKQKSKVSKGEPVPVSIQLPKSTFWEERPQAATPRTLALTAGSELGLPGVPRPHAAQPGGAVSVSWWRLMINGHLID